MNKIIRNTEFWSKIYVENLQGNDWKEGGKMWKRESRRTQQEKGICRRAKWHQDVFFGLMMCKGGTSRDCYSPFTDSQ